MNVVMHSETKNKKKIDVLIVKPIQKQANEISTWSLFHSRTLGEGKMQMYIYKKKLEATFAPRLG